MATKILIDQNDFMLLNAVKVYMSIDRISPEAYIQTMLEHSQAALEDVFDKLGSDSEMLITLSNKRIQTISSNGISSPSLIRK